MNFIIIVMYFQEREFYYIAKFVDLPTDQGMRNN